MSREWLSLSVSFCFKVCLSTSETLFGIVMLTERECVLTISICSLVNVIYSQPVGSVDSKEVLTPSCRGDLESGIFFFF